MSSLFLARVRRLGLATIATIVLLGSATLPAAMMVGLLRRNVLDLTRPGPLIAWDRSIKARGMVPRLILVGALMYAPFGVGLVGVSVMKERYEHRYW